MGENFHVINQIPTKFFHDFYFVPSQVKILASPQHSDLRYSQLNPRPEIPDSIFITRVTGKMVVVYVLILDFSDRKANETNTI
jgi:hypothetical protein